MLRTASRIVVPTVAWLVADALVAQTTVVVPCGADNTLYQSATGALSNGAGVGVFVGLSSTGLVRRGLLWFDVAAAVPAGATVLTVRFDANVSNSPTAVAEPVFAHRVLQPWGEGTSVASAGGGNGGPAAPNDATWLHRFHPGTFWGTAGGDFAAAPSFQASLPPLGAFASPPSAAAVADVQQWLDVPASNHGWLLKGLETSLQTTHRLDSRESAGVRPTLTVTYVLPGQSIGFGAGCGTGFGTLQAVWVGVPFGGSTVQVQKTGAPPNGLGADFFALAIDPVGPELWPGCSLWLPVTGIVPGSVFVADASGSASAPFLVPSGHAGQLVACQAAVLTAAPAGFAASNAAVTVLP